MDTPVVLSHRTAWLFHHAPTRQRAVQTALNSPRDMYGLSEPHLTAAQVAKRVARFLSDCGIPCSCLSSPNARASGTHKSALAIDLLVATSQDRTSSRSIRTHVLGRPFDSNHLLQVAPSLFVVDEALNLIQAATWMEPIELLEYGFELCGCYECSPLNPSSGYIECKPRCSVQAIRDTLDSVPNMRGAHRVRRALARMRDNSRSPMETALALSILLPQDDGGLGYRNITLNQRIPVPAALKPQFASEYLEADVFAPKHKVDIEYDGSDHADLARRTHDSNRTSAFSALGITQRTLTSRHFAHQLEFHRAMNGIASLLNVNVPPTLEFQRKQNELRLTLIRNWRRRDNRA